MKTKLQHSALFLIISVMSIQLFALDIQFEDEAYINDIPFNTELIVNNMVDATFNFEEEKYINDIPFNTYEIAFEASTSDSDNFNFEIEEEAYINDIPFDTRSISNAYNYKLAISQVFEIEEEKNIDDIPFETYAIANKAQLAEENDYVAFNK